MAGIHRRNFLKLGAATTGALSCPTLLHGMELRLGGDDFHQIRTFHPRGKRPYVCTLCPYFDGGFAYSEGDRIKKTEGIPDHVATRGKFCAKGLASFLGADDPDRILYPMKRVGARGAGQWKKITWEEAIAEVAGKVKTALADPDSIVLNEGGFKDGGPVRFMDTIGSRSVIRSRYPNIGTASRQLALQDATGVDFLLPDLEHTRYVLNFGANIIETALPLAQRLTDGIVNNRLKMVSFDVRMSNTAGRSDEFYPVFPGSDGIIALAMANVIMQKGLADRAFIDTWTNYSSAILAESLQPFTLEMAEKASGVPADEIKKIAIEFAKARPGVIFSQNGVSWHKNAIDGETACLILAAVTGNIEKEGGYCLPRKFDIAAVKPEPKKTGSATRTLNYTFPFELKTGSRQVQVLFNHMSNPVYSSPAASVWGEVMKDEKLIPYIVDFSPFMSESSELADIILPDVVGVERHDVASAPTALWRWASMSRPPHKARGQAVDVRETLKKIVHAIDADGSRGLKKYWGFKNAKDWVKKEISGTKGLGKKGYKKMRKRGVWPSYGKIDPANRQIVRKNGEPIEAQYGQYKKSGFPTGSGKIELRAPAWNKNPAHENLAPDQFVLTTFKVAYHALSATANLKYLAEMWHSNPLWLNQNVARKMGIQDGSLVRVSSEVGYLVTKAWLTQGIHPQVVGISTSVGRTSYGRVARADSQAKAPFADPSQEDLDIDDNVWWRDAGTNPNDIIPIDIDPETGVQAWNDTVVSVAPAKPGDKYGDIKVDNAKHMAIYKKLLG